MIPEIKGPDSHDFHDSSLIDFVVSPYLDEVSIVVSTPDEHLIERLWLIEFKGVLRLEYETLGNGTGENYNPLEIYDIGNEHLSEERSRWIKRLEVLGVDAKEANNLLHIVLASSFMRGWGKNEDMEGINIICRSVTVVPAPDKYKGMEYSTPRIEGDDAD